MIESQFSSDTFNTTTIEAFRKSLYQQMNVSEYLFDQSNLSITALTDQITRQVSIRWRLDLLGCKVNMHDVDYYTHPETWWDAFKGRWFPKWAVRKWPVKTKRITVLTEHWHMCPHLSNPKHDDHILFLAHR